MSIIQSKRTYALPAAGLPSQTERFADRAIFTNAYAFMPRTVMTDIVTSYLPFWEKTRLWVIARPLTGFSESFSHYIMEVSAGGGSERPDDNINSEHVIFIVDGSIELKYEGITHVLQPGSYAYLPAGLSWQIHNKTNKKAVFHWIRKRYIDVEGIDRPQAFITSDEEIIPVSMPDTNGVWQTSLFVDPFDMSHDMHVTIVTFQPGGVLPFAETHVMEHGLYVLQGRGAYYLNGDWREVEEGDYMWLRAFCPQACYAAGDRPFRYLLYKDVNRHMPLHL